MNKLLVRTLHLVLFLPMVGWCTAQSTSPDDALAHARLTYSQQGAKAALPEFEQILESYRKAGDRRGEAITTGLIGNCYKRMGDYPKAIALLNSALQIKREIGDRPEEGKTLNHLGLVYWEQGEYAKAIEFLNQSISVARQLEDARLEASSLNNLSLVYDEQGDYRRSLEQYQRALELHRSVKYEPGESDTLGNIGGVYLLLGRYSEAERYYRQALEISQRLGLKPSEAQDLGNLAECLLGEGKLQSSLATYDQAIALAHAAGLAREEADWYRGKASALLRLGKFEEALKDYQSAGETYSRAGLQRELVQNVGDVGRAYLELGDRRGAEKNYLRAVSISKTIGHERGIIANELALAEVLWLSEEYLRARTNAEHALAQARKLDDAVQITYGLLLIAQILRDDHQTAAALRKTEEANELAKRSGLLLVEGEALDQQGELLLRRREPRDALAQLDTALQIAQDSGDVDLLWKTHYHRGQALERLKRAPEALQAYEAAVHCIEGVRGQISHQSFRTGYFQDKQRVYIALVRLLLRMEKPGEAFEYSEELREYSYQSLRNREVVTEAAEPDLETRSRMTRLQEMLERESSRPSVQQRSQALKILTEEMQDAKHDYDLTIDAPKGNGHARASAMELSQILPQDAALIEYVVADDQLAIFAITRTGLHALTEPVAERDLRSKVELFRDLMTEPAGDQWRKPAASLYRLLIAPLERRNLLSTIHKLIIVPHGVLHYLPFAVLPRSTDGHFTFLVQNYEITELPAATLVKSSHARQMSPTQRMITFAPLRSGLKFAIPEAQNVAEIFGQSGEAVTGASATKERFENSAPHYDFVHIATHGFFNKANPMLSGLQLEPGVSDDGRLQVHEILAMHFNSRLITLSACDTALGSGNFAEIPAGDEFVGLNRAFLEAGSDAVVASLWKVSDRSTLVMMDDFYRRVAREGGPAALAQTQRMMLRNPRYASPYYWGPFVFMGQDLGSSIISAERN